MTQAKSLIPIPRAQQSRSPARAIFGHVADRGRIFSFHKSSLSRLIEAVFTTLAEAGWSIKGLIHLPSGMGPGFAKRFHLPIKVRAGSVWICDTARSDNGFFSEVIGSLRHHHPLRRELLIFLIGDQICTVVSASPIAVRGKGRQADPLWNSFISFAPAETAQSAASCIPILNAALGKDFAEPLLREAVDTLSRNSSMFSQSGVWGEFLVEVARRYEQSQQKHESDLKRSQLFNRIQSAVGSELDAEKLFPAMARVLKETVGFDYAELRYLESSGSSWKITSTEQQNDTDYGGPLLTLILRKEKMAEILRGKKPVLIHAADAGEYLANPKLISIMGLESGVILPLIHQRRPNGLLKLFSSGINHFSKFEADEFRQIGGILARSVENVQVHSVMRRMATIDGLTNVYNRRYFSEQLNLEFKRARRYQNDLCLVMIDIDHFKHYNDTNGHLAGDKVLAGVANIVKSTVREVDLVARYGGEEFVIVLPETNVKDGYTVAEKIRQAIATHPFANGEKQPNGRVTISVGLAESNAGVETATDLNSRADSALYRAKKAGRNRCEIY